MYKIIAEPNYQHILTAPRTAGREPLNIFFIAPEGLPFSQTGGLGEVPPGLTKELVERGHNVTLIIPCHTGSLEAAIKGRLPILYLPEYEKMSLEMGTEELRANVYRTRLSVKNGNPKVLLVDSEGFDYFGGRRYRQLYSHADDKERYYFFSLVAANLVRKAPNTGVHTHDWQTGYVPILLKSALLSREAPTVHTIHNLRYHSSQTRKEFWEMSRLPDEFFPGLYSSSGINPAGTDLADPTWAALSVADVINTVSPSYAKETLTKKLGYEFAPLLQKRANETRYFGIVNGIDKEWFPHFNHSNFVTEKTQAKKIVQQNFGLNEDPNTMLIMMAARLDDQKGFNLVIPVLKELLKSGINFQFVITTNASDEIGKKYAKELVELSQTPEFLGRIGFITPYNKELTKVIYAGADISLVPSQFEPCGLVAPASMINGAVPIGRKTGGIADIIEHGKNGFLFEGEWPSTPLETSLMVSNLTKIILSVHQLFIHKDGWHTFVEGMLQEDHSWKASAGQYENLYYYTLDRFKVEGHYRAFGYF